MSRSFGRVEDAVRHSIIIIGAGRSGTKMLRDLLCRMPGLETWPCDEINLIWRHGNRRIPHDEFERSDATPEVKAFIRGAFRRQARRAGAEVLVEKTCANSLRLGFVDEVFPEARFVVLFRDGRDVVASAMRRWVAPFDLRYTLRKARFVPPSDIVPYGVNFVLNRLHRLRSADGHIRSWGPRFEGMEAMAREWSLVEVCAEQWRRCVMRTCAALDAIDPERVHIVRYEDIVRDPVESVRGLASFIGVRVGAERVSELAAPISPSSVGSWRSDLSTAEHAKVSSILEPQLDELGYGD